MGNSETKLNFRKAVIQLTTRIQPVDANDDAFWDQFWTESVDNIQDVFALVPAAEIRALREESPSNLATLCYKAVEKLVLASENGCHTDKEHQIVLNSARLLTRILPYVFEDVDWQGFFWTSHKPVPDSEAQENATPLAQSLIMAISNLLFCPEFCVVSHHKKGSPDKADDVVTGSDSCEYIWEAGVGFPRSPPTNSQIDLNRTELLKLLLTCFSESIYMPSSQNTTYNNKWIEFFCSAENFHVLPMFTSLLNVVCAYDPVGLGVPYNHLLFRDYREPLVEVACQILIVTLDHTSKSLEWSDCDYGSNVSLHSVPTSSKPGGSSNLFINYVSRLHRDEDFAFILGGICRLLNNPLQQTYLPGSVKRVNFHQELLVMFWKLCDANKKFLFYVLKSSDVLDVLVPILYHLNDARADHSRVGLVHIGVFILLLLSGERNFGVRLNKPFSAAAPTDVPAFAGTHADFLVLIFHRVITAGHQRLQPLYDCLLTIIVNVSPYLKSLSMTASSKLLHLLEAFSTPWFLFSAPQNHHLVFFLLEVFNNIIQYQFDGNSNLIYTIIRKRHVFHQLANLPTDSTSLAKGVNKTRGRKVSESSSFSSDRLGAKNVETDSKDDIAEPSVISTTLAATPHLQHITSQYPNEALSEQRDENDRESVATDRPQYPDQNSKLTSSFETVSTEADWTPSVNWVHSWKSKLPLQTIMRMLQVLVPQVEKICIDKNLTDETEILKFLQHGTLVGLLPVPHPILIRKYQTNAGTTSWFRTYMWGVIYLRNIDPPVWYDTDVKLFDIQRV
ncbi:protein HID1-like [Clavelina lepadiformis]|uniref:protein HID1-like n=1 Tax=Clavelina lepadiformis TaxID=159417 RepID=UPI004041419F